MPSAKSSVKSAEAQERRREQNRIAQRNHRNKVRERQIAENLRASPVSDMFLEMTKEANQWPSAPGSTTSSISYPPGQFPMSMNMLSINPALNVDFSSASYACTNCIGTETFSQPQMDQLFSANPPEFAVETFNWPSATSRADVEATIMASSDIPTAPVPIHNRTNSMVCSPTPAPSGIISTENIQPRTPPPAIPPPSERENSQTPCLTRKNNSESMTQRFTKLLNYMQECGFNTFDDAAALYYTHSFDKQSAPDAAQRTSRGRRLRKVLADIEECSSDWSTWEVRGYQDKIMEAAESLYGAEMTNISGMNEPPPLGWLHQSYDPHQDLSSFQNVYQNKVPNLWNTLYSLTGAQGASGELAATAALSVLHWSASNPAASFEDILSAMATKPPFLQSKMDDADSGYGSASSTSTSRSTTRFSSSESIPGAFS